MNTVVVDNEPMTSEEFLVDGQNIEFDINDPSLVGFSVDMDFENVPVQIRPAPPSDGVHRVRMRLANREGGAVYIKGNRVDGRPADLKVVAWVDCRVINKETGEEGAFLKTWYPTSQVFKGQSGSALTALYFLTTGEPIRPSVPGRSVTVLDIKNAIETMFAEAGEGGIDGYVQTRWHLSVPKTQEVLDSEGQGTGLYAYVYKEGQFDANGNPVKDYDEIKGENRIKKIRALQGIPEERAHLWWEPVLSEERSVQAEVVSLKDSSNFEEV